jgi:hypothetical protein
MGMGPAWGWGVWPLVQRRPAMDAAAIVCFLVKHGIDQRHGDGGQTQGFAVARAGEDDVFHAGATEAFRRLFAEHPTDGIAQVGLATAVGAYDGSDAAAIEAEFGAVTERLETLQFDAL